MHHIEISLRIKPIYNRDAEHIKLTQNDDQTYSWNIYSMGQTRPLRQHRGTLKKLEEDQVAKGHTSNPAIWDQGQKLNIIGQDDQGDQYEINVGSISIHTHHPQKSAKRIIFHAGNYRINRPDYDITAIYTMPAQDAANYILSHIPTDHIIQHYIHSIPHQSPKNPSIRHHYTPHLSSTIPCVSSQIANKRNIGLRAQIYRTISILPPDPLDQYIRIGTSIDDNMAKPNDLCIDPNNSIKDIIPTLSQHIYTSYMERPDINALSQHEQIRIHRVFRDHAHTIANQVYHDAVQHRAAYFQSLLFTFPYITP